MEKSEFSETQFVIGYTRELLNSFNYASPFFYNLYAPSTKEEKKYASDLILKHFKGRYYRYSEFYQFKRSKFFNKEVFSDLSGKIVIDTSLTPKYGFSIYNSVKTKQFNTLQKLAHNIKYRVYYAAPLFHTVKQFNNYFNSITILSNSILFDLSQPNLNSAVIPLNSNHQIIFDRTTSHICSDPLEIQGILASERDSNPIRENSQENNLEYVVKDLYNFVVDEIKNSELNNNFIAPDMNLFEVHNLLLSYFNIHWFPIFNKL